MRLVPRRFRFTAIVTLSDAIAGVLSRVRPFSDDQLLLDGPRELVLHRVMDVLTRYGCLFHPALDAPAVEAVVATAASRRGLLVIGPHTLLNTVVLRHLHDAGLDPLVFAKNLLLPLPGSVATVRAVTPAAGSLIRARTELRKGGVVCALVDRRRPEPVEFEVGHSSIGVTQELIHLALRLDAAVFFALTRLEGRRVSASLIEPAAEARRSVGEMVGEFVRIVRAHVESRRRTV